MKYTFLVEKKNSLLKNHTIAYIASSLGVTNVYLCQVFNGNRSISKHLAYAIVKFIDVNNEIDDYFKGE